MLPMQLIIFLTLVLMKLVSLILTVNPLYHIPLALTLFSMYG